MGIERLGAKSVGGAGAQLPGGADLKADLDNLGFQIDKENVLKVYKLFQSQAENLQALMDANSYKLQVGLCGIDPVSYDASHAYTDKLTKYKNQCSTYVQMLSNVADQLRQSARSYGYTDEQIARALGLSSQYDPPSMSTVAPTQPAAPILTPAPSSPMGSIVRSYPPPTAPGTPEPPRNVGSGLELDPTVEPDENGWRPLARQATPVPNMYPPVQR